MSKQVIVAHLPTCDLCADGTKAKYDARLPLNGCWANLCETHFQQFECKLGTGRGQRLILKEGK